MKQQAATAKVSASKASAQPLPTRTTSRPATPLPTISAMFWLIRRQEIACCSKGAGTVCWVIADELGLPRALSDPLSMPRPASNGMLDQPPIRESATSPCTTAAAAEVPCSITGARQPVSEHAAEEDGGDVGQGVEADHDPEVGGVAAEVEHGEGEGHRCDPAAEEVDRVAGDQPPERRVPQRVIGWTALLMPRKLFASEIFVNEVVRRMPA